MHDLQRSIELLSALTVTKLSENTESEFSALVCFTVKDVSEDLPQQLIEWPLELAPGICVPLRSQRWPLNKDSIEDIAELANEFADAASSCWNDRQALIDDFRTTQQLVNEELERIRSRIGIVSAIIEYTNDHQVPDVYPSLKVTVTRYDVRFASKGEFFDVETFSRDVNTWLESASPAKEPMPDYQ